MYKTFGITLRAYRQDTDTGITLYFTVRAENGSKAAILAWEKKAKEAQRLPDFKVSPPSIPVRLNDEFEVQRYLEGGICNVTR